MSAVAHPDLGTNTSATWVFDSAAAGTGGDVEEAIAAARVDGVVVERQFRQQRLIPAFMEPRSTVVDPTGEQITMWSATQVPHLLRIFLALVTFLVARETVPRETGEAGSRLVPVRRVHRGWRAGRPGRSRRLRG